MLQGNLILIKSYFLTNWINTGYQITDSDEDETMLYC